MNFGQAKRAALAVLGSLSIDGADIPGSYNMQEDQIKRMAYWADLAQKELSRTNAPIERRIEIASGLPNNLLGGSLASRGAVKHRGNETVRLRGRGGRSFYIEVDAPCKLSVFVGDAFFKSYIITDKPKRFFSIKDLIDNPKGLLVTLELLGDYPYNYRNEAMYQLTYETADDIPDYGEYGRFSDRARDVFRVVPSGVEFISKDGGAGDFRYIGEELYIGMTKPGVWRICYWAYPEDIDEYTPQGYEFEIPAFAHDAVVMKMAYGLCVDMGFTTATYQAFKAEHAQLFNGSLPQERYKEKAIRNVY